MVNTGGAKITGINSSGNYVKDAGKRIVGEAADKTINELTDRMIVDENEDLKISNLDIDNSFRGEMLAQVKEGLVSGLVTL
ncbi:MAG: hypothetical protein ACK5NF_03190 [Bacilli bacterium]